MKYIKTEKITRRGKVHADTETKIYAVYKVSI